MAGFFNKLFSEQPFSIFFLRNLRNKNVKLGHYFSMGIQSNNSPFFQEFGNESYRGGVTGIRYNSINIEIHIVQMSHSTYL